MTSFKIFGVKFDDNEMKRVINDNLTSNLHSSNVTMSLFLKNLGCKTITRILSSVGCLCCFDESP